VSTQLRLVETLPPAPRTGRPATRTGNGSRKRSGQPARKATRTVTPSRRSVQWGEWHLDARTRTVGRAGVAAARRALQEAAASEQLSEAS
jgi:hypothetical protein